jgi:hypothetical protein
MHTQQLAPQLSIPSSQTIPDQMRRGILVAFVHPRTRRAVSRPREVLYGIGTLRFWEWGVEGEDVWDGDFGDIGVGRVGEVGSDEESGFFRGDSVPYYGVCLSLHRPTAEFSASNHSRPSVAITRNRSFSPLDGWILR